MQEQFFAKMKAVDFAKEYTRNNPDTIIYVVKNSNIFFVAQDTKPVTGVLIGEYLFGQKLKPGK